MSTFKVREFIFPFSPLQGEEESVGPRKGVEAGLENDFAFNNNVAGASKHVRLGEARLLQAWLALT